MNLSKAAHHIHTHTHILWKRKMGEKMRTHKIEAAMKLHQKLFMLTGAYAFIDHNQRTKPIVYTNLQTKKKKIFCKRIALFGWRCQVSRLKRYVNQNLQPYIHTHHHHQVNKWKVFFFFIFA